MEKYKSVLTFKDYIVQEASFKLNDNFESDTERYDVDFDVKSIINYEDDYSYVALICSIGDKENSACPFVIDVTINGIFEFEGDDESREKFMKVSAVAILFPYLRSLISDLSTKSNLFPTYHLPLINVAKYMEDEEKIHIVDNRTKEKG